MSKEVLQGKCVYCGQVQVITLQDMLDAEATEQELDWMATNRCRCPKAERKRRIDAAHQAIDRVCVEWAERRRMDVLSAEQVRSLKIMAEQVWDGEVDVVTFRVSDVDTVRLKMRDDKVQVKRTVKLEAEAE